MNEQKLLEIEELLYNKLLIFLSSKPRSSWEVETRLKRYLQEFNKLKSVQKELLRTNLISRLTDQSLVNDENYAAQYVKEKIQSSKPVSKSAIVSFLVKKKIPKENIDIAIQEYSPNIEIEKLKLLAEKKWLTLKSDNLHTKKQKIKKYLMNKGYPYAAISPVVESISDVK